MSGYSKLFSEIVMSTVWREPHTVRIVWITMLALKDRWHIVNASIPGLADASRVSIEECKNALKVLSSPDPDSRSKEFEGRRIQETDGGWLILNGEKWRNKMSLDERREYNRIKQREYRQSVKSCVQSSTKSAHTDSDTDSDSNKRTCSPQTVNNFDFELFWKEYPRKQAKKTTRRLWIKLAPSPERVSVILEALRQAKDLPQWEDKQFIPLPTTWLNGERWEDEIIKEKSVKEIFAEKMRGKNVSNIE